MNPSLENRNGQDLMLETDAGQVRARLHAASGGSGIVWVFGAGGGLGGPAGGLYERLAARLQPERISSLQVAYRRPGYLQPCVEDTLAGARYLVSLGATGIILVGHSFGGAVVINAAASSALVIAVAALSSQSSHTEAASKLSPRPLLLLHGERDEVLSPECSRTIYRRARDPKRLVLYPGCLHGLDQCRDEIDRDLTAWIRETVTAQADVPAQP